MKRFLGILIGLMVFISCDDGDLVEENIEFDDVEVQSCSDNNLIFKLKDSEALILNIPEDTFVQNPTPEGEPLKLKIDGTNQVFYNFYNGKVASANICDLVPPASPSVTSQLKGTEGTIEIVITTVYVVDQANSSTRISGYNYNIVFKNIKFVKEDGSFQLYETLNFGIYFKAIDPSLPFSFNQVLKNCDTKNDVYEFNESESLILVIDPSLIVNEVTPINTPRVGTIGLVTNKLTYNLYNSVVPTDYFCKVITPSLPTINQTWQGEVGGTIEVSTTTNGPNSYLHTILFKNVKLKKGNSSFLLGNSYKFGDLQTIKP